MSTSGSAEKVRVGLVTGAGQGIGEAIARELAARGYRLVVMGRAAAGPQVAADLGALAVQGSFAETSDLQRLVDTALDAHARIDVVVNNGGHAATGDLLDIADDQWHEGLDLLLLNVVRMARLVTPALRAAGGGSIVNVSTF